MNSIKEEADDLVNGILDNIDGHKNCNDGRRNNIAKAAKDFCNTNTIGIKSAYATILTDKEGYSNTTLSGEKSLLSHRVSNKPEDSWTNIISNVALNATIENLRHSNFGIPKKHILDLDINPSEPLGKYQCFVCPLNFAKKYSLSKHLMKHFDSNRPFMCPVCEKTFQKKDGLKTHINGWADITPHQCEQCDEAFTTCSKLSKHRKKSHSGISPFKCAKCDYKSFQLNDLKRHTSVTHMDERRFKCKYCPFASKTQKYLTTHEMIHKEDKQYKCDICYSRFVQQQSVRVHRKTHFLKGLIVHRCRFCSSELESPHALRKHVEIVHGES